MNPTPEQLAEMWQDYQQRKVQQISYPVDEASKNALGVATKVGDGSKTLTQVIAAVPASVPAAYGGTVILLIDGVQREIPYLL